MHIICPHCTTSYAINLATLGAAGRTVRCSRCKEVWLARPEDATELAGARARHGGQPPRRPATDDAAAEWEAHGARRRQRGNPRRRQPLDIGRLAVAEGEAPPSTDWPSVARDDMHARGSRAPAATGPGSASFSGRRRRLARRGKPSISPATACAAMGALVLALMIWRVDVVRLLPQTAAFYRLVGLDVNLRGLMFKDVKITTETVDGKPVLVIEGVITGEAKKPVELPRLRFSVRDAQGAEIYAWNAVLEQPVLKPGERAWFKSRLASPPPEGRNIDVRFFNKRDIAGGHA